MIHALPLLAQAEAVPAEAIKNYFLIVAAILACGYYIKEIFFSGSRRDITPQPLVVRHAEDLAHKEELIDLKRSTEEKLDTMQVESKSDRGKLYEKVDEVRQELTDMHEDTRAEMNRGFKDLERAIGRLEGKMGNGH